MKFTTAEGTILQLARDVREVLKQDETASRFDFSIEVTGRLHEGDIKITFSVTIAYDAAVRGGRIEAVLSEALRRRGWAAINEPLCIEHQPERPVLAAPAAIDDEETPF